MNKKSQILEAGIAIGMIVLTIWGVTSVLIEGNKVFYGDKSNMQYYEYSSCPQKANSIPKVNLTLFKSENEAKELGYTRVEKCE